MTENFTQISNDILRSNQISLEAKGLYAILSSNDENWQHYTTQITTLSTNGKYKTNKTLSELENAGLLKREQERTNGKFGKMKWTLYNKVNFNRCFTDENDNSISQNNENSESATKNINSKNIKKKKKKSIYNKQNSISWNDLDQESQNKFKQNAIAYAKELNLDENTVDHFISYIKAHNKKYADIAEGFKVWCHNKLLKFKEEKDEDNSYYGNLYP